MWLCKHVSDLHSFLFGTVCRRSDPEMSLHTVMLSEQDIFGLPCFFVSYTSPVIIDLSMVSLLFPITWPRVRH